MYGEDDPDVHRDRRRARQRRHEGRPRPASSSRGGAPSGADVGEYAITASGATNPNYDINYVTGTETITPAPLTITADDKSRVYGEDSPAYSASYDGFVNGDDEGDVDGLEITGGAPAGADVGDYPIQVSGATSPNYDIDLVAGTEHVTPAPLTITADDKTKVYGADEPGVHRVVRRAGQRRHEGRRQRPEVRPGRRAARVSAKYAITPSGASNPNYDITYAAGTETITPAPLTIRPADVAVASGQVPTYSWHGDGWVNGDSDATLSQPGRTRADVHGDRRRPGRVRRRDHVLGGLRRQLLDRLHDRVPPGRPGLLPRATWTAADGEPEGLPGRLVGLPARGRAGRPVRQPAHLPVPDGAARRRGHDVRDQRGALRRTGHRQHRRHRQVPHHAPGAAAGRGELAASGSKEAVRLDQRWDAIQALIDPRRNAKLQSRPAPRSPTRCATRRARASGRPPPRTCSPTPRPSTGASAGRAGSRPPPGRGAAPGRRHRRGRRGRRGCWW